MLRSLIVLALLSGCSRTEVSRIETDSGPAAPTVAIDPAEPVTTDRLTVEILDREPVRYTYAWTRDGEQVPDATSDLVQSSLTAKGQVWQVAVTPSDAGVEGRPGVAEVVIANSPPTVSARWSVDEPRPDDGLEVIATPADADDDEVSLSYAWTRDGDAFSATGPVIDSSETEPEQVWTVTITPHDGEDEGEPITLTTTIGSSGPVVESVTLAPDPAFTLTPITASATASHPDGDPTSLRYAWFVNGTDTGRTGSTLPETVFVKHDEVFVEVTAVSGDDLSHPFASDSLTVLNSPPAAPIAPALNPWRATTDVDLDCSIGEPAIDDDEDPLTYAFEWYRDGAFYDGEETASLEVTLPSSVTSVGELWHCRVRAIDDEGAPSAWSEDSPIREIREEGSGGLEGARVLYFSDSARDTNGMIRGAHALEADGIIELDYTTSNTTALSWLRSDTEYDLIVYFIHSGGWSATNETELVNYVRDGGRLIYHDWRRSSTNPLLAEMEASYASGSNEQPITILDPDLADGLPSPVPLSNPGWGTWATGFNALGGAVSVCRFPSGQSCMVLGNEGRTIAVGFLSDTPSTTNGEILIENLMRFVTD